MNSQHTSGEQRRSELTELRRELRDKQSYLSEGREDLWADISRWLHKSYNVPVGSLRTMIRSEMASLQENPQHKMYDHPDVDDGTEAFPERCKGCPHYGVQCPVLARHVSKQTYQRIFEQAEDDDDLQGKLSAFAAKHHCQVIQEAIGEWKEGYATFLREGERLRTLLLADIGDIDLDEHRFALDDVVNATDETALSGVENGSKLSEDLQPTPPTANGHDVDRPPEEDAERVESISESIMAEDDEAET